MDERIRNFLSEDNPEYRERWMLVRGRAADLFNKQMFNELSLCARGLKLREAVNHISDACLGGEITVAGAMARFDVIEADMEEREGGRQRVERIPGVGVETKGSEQERIAREMRLLEIEAEKFLISEIAEAVQNGTMTAAEAIARIEKLRPGEYSEEELALRAEIAKREQEIEEVGRAVASKKMTIREAIDRIRELVDFTEFDSGIKEIVGDE